MKPLLDILSKSYGLSVPPSLVGAFEQKVRARMSSLGIKDCQAYEDIVRSNRSELHRIVSFVTVNVSHFFRNPLVFETLYRIVLPEMLRKKKEDGSLVFNVWSAGCAKAEEPYSAAILLRELMLQLGLRFNVQIFATDIDREILSQAGVQGYGPDQVKNVRYGWLNKYFHYREEKFWPSNEIKEMIYLSYYDMTDTKTYVPPESVFGNFDLVLCRNLLIYYAQEHQYLIFDKLYRSLADRGCLVLGSAESLPAAYKRRFSKRDAHCRIYMKQS